LKDTSLTIQKSNATVSVISIMPVQRSTILLTHQLQHHEFFLTRRDNVRNCRRAVTRFQRGEWLGYIG
jgi:hypothetical protein